ncbi:MAG: hypothetical protein ABI721_03570 [Candidatus Dojkabacteria bacterium]
MHGPFGQFDEELNKPIEQRLDRIARTIVTPSDSAYFSWEMNLNLAQFNAAQVVIFAYMILKSQSVKAIYDYLSGDDYTSSALNALKAGHASDEAMKRVASNFAQTRDILKKNNNIVTDELKKKFISLTSLNFLFESINLIYHLTGHAKLERTYTVMRVDGDNFFNFKEDRININSIETEFEDIIFNEFAFENNNQFNEVIERIRKASLYCINSGPAFYDAMVKSRNELKGATGMSRLLQDIYDQINEDLRVELDYPDFNKRMDGK